MSDTDAIYDSDQEEAEPLLADQEEAEPSFCISGSGTPSQNLYDRVDQGRPSQILVEYFPIEWDPINPGKSCLQNTRLRVAPCSS